MKRMNGAFYLNQSQAITKVIELVQLDDTRSVATPMDVSALAGVTCPLPGSEEASLLSTLPYREAIGSLTHIMRKTRPDIAFSVSVVARFMHNPAFVHWKAVQRIVKYLHSTQDLTFQVGGGDTLDQKLEMPSFQGFADADWAGDSASSKSTTGYGFFRRLVNLMAVQIAI
jgi:hypothetical protein